MTALDAAHAEIAQLRTAITRRAPIDQAKGMIMLACTCDADEAFAILVRTSQSRGVKLRDLALEVCADAVSGRARQAGSGRLGEPDLTSIALFDGQQ